MICNGVTKFYRIEIDKGGDDTYTVSFSASATTNFLLYGRANYTAVALTDGQAAVNDNAVGLIFGTLEIGSNIQLPALSYSTDSYIIYKGARAAGKRYKRRGYQTAGRNGKYGRHYDLQYDKRCNGYTGCNRRYRYRAARLGHAGGLKATV